MHMEFPWKTTGIVLTAPLSHEVDATVRLIDEYLAPRGFNMIVLQVRYRYQFKTHPEVWGYDPLSYEDVKKLVAVCKKHNVKLVPKMNLIGHQSGFPTSRRTVFFTDITIRHAIFRTDFCALTHALMNSRRSGRFFMPAVYA